LGDVIQARPATFDSLNARAHFIGHQSLGKPANISGKAGWVIWGNLSFEMPPEMQVVPDFHVAINCKDMRVLTPDLKFLLRLVNHAR
jgi:hypothetical protein